LAKVLHAEKATQRKARKQKSLLTGRFGVLAKVPFNVIEREKKRKKEK